jgi:hypothetical protein
MNPQSEAQTTTKEMLQLNRLDCQNARAHEERD